MVRKQCRTSNNDPVPIHRTDDTLSIDDLDVAGATRFLIGEGGNIKDGRAERIVNGQQQVGRETQNHRFIAVAEYDHGRDFRLVFGPPLFRHTTPDSRRTSLCNRQNRTRSHCRYN